MAAYIEHAAYFVQNLDWDVSFFQEVFGMKIARQRVKPDGLGEVWLDGGIQLVQTEEPQNANGRAAHLALIVDDLEGIREKALAWGCSPMPKNHWVQMPDGLQLELFTAKEGAIEALLAQPKK